MDAGVGVEDGASVAGIGVSIVDAGEGGGLAVGASSGEGGVVVCIGGGVLAAGGFLCCSLFLILGIGGAQE